MSKPTLYVVHCIDTEGPLDEDPLATIQQVNQIFGLSLDPAECSIEAIRDGTIDLGSKGDEIKRFVSPSRLAYNRTWGDVNSMLDEALSTEFRRRQIDDFGSGWVYSWHCVDHMGFNDNPRSKSYGYGAIFRHYKRRASHGDEIHWHFHPLSLRRDATSCASSFRNSWDVLSHILCRRILEDRWFPVVNRPGFHTERPDSHSFLEQWIPFDYANQRHDQSDTAQLDLQFGRFGDWGRAPGTWRGYRPDHDDYQVEGNCRRWIFRCLNVGTRLRLLEQHHVAEAFAEARSDGSAILSFADHDYRDIRGDVEAVRKMLHVSRGDFPDVAVRFAGAEFAARSHLGIQQEESLKLSAMITDNRLVVETVRGKVFGPQPFLSLKSRDGRFFNDNFDVLEPGRSWSYMLDSHTIEPNALEAIGVGAAGWAGGFDTEVIALA